MAAAKVSPQLIAAGVAASAYVALNIIDPKVRSFTKQSLGFISDLIGHPHLPLATVAINATMRAMDPSVTSEGTTTVLQVAATAGIMKAAIHWEDEQKVKEGLQTAVCGGLGIAGLAAINHALKS